MEEKKCIVIFEGTFNEGMRGSDVQKEYSERSSVNAEVFGGFEVLSSYSFEKNLGSGLIPDFLLITQYQSKEKVIQSLETEEYKSIIPLRDQTFKEIKILITQN